MPAAESCARSKESRRNGQPPCPAGGQPIAHKQTQGMFGIHIYVVVYLDLAANSNGHTTE